MSMGSLHWEIRFVGQYTETRTLLTYNATYIHYSLTYDVYYYIHAHRNSIRCPRSAQAYLHSDYNEQTQATWKGLCVQVSFFTRSYVWTNLGRECVYMYYTIYMLLDVHNCGFTLKPNSCIFRYAVQLNLPLILFWIAYIATTRKAVQ